MSLSLRFGWGKLRSMAAAAMLLISFGPAFAQECHSNLAIEVAVPSGQKVPGLHIFSRRLPGSVLAYVTTKNLSDHMVTDDVESGDAGFALRNTLILKFDDGRAVSMTHLAKRVYGIDTPRDDEAPLSFESFMGHAIPPHEMVTRMVNLDAIFEIKSTETYSLHVTHIDPENRSCTITSNTVDFSLER